MRKQIFRNLLAVICASVLFITMMFMWLSYRQVGEDTYADLQREAQLLVSVLKNPPAETDLDFELETFKNLDFRDRVTIIRSNGDPVFDNYADYHTMDNHSDRVEVQQALIQGWGRSRRASDTLSKEVFYYAQILPTGEVLRLSRTSDIAFKSLQYYFFIMLAVLLVVFGVAYLLARSITEKALRPLLQLNLDAEVKESYPELVPLVSRFAEQKKLLELEVERYKNKKQELKAVTNNMVEGMLFLDNNLQIITINKSGAKFFGLPKNKLLGKSIFEVVQEDKISELLNNIYFNGKGKLLMNQGSSYYQINGSKINDVGLSLIIMDVTEQTASEKLRREFSANVTHELKTPLQSVLGYSEIMLNGLVKDSDRQRFLQKIYDEARNLLALIDDILKLSRLDELNHDMLEEFSLQDVVKRVVARLQDKADKHQVQLQLAIPEGSDWHLLGMASLMEEVISNLVDNAIKYNKPGGNIKLTFIEKESKYAIDIEDNGIGIAADELSHIFERFYRVDRSRSKGVEGTGIGLSIVKHGVMFHGGTVKVYSKLGEGTRFVLKFPKSRE